MRLVSYNILDGGTGRVDLLARVIAAQQPDGIALVEADDASVVEELARRFSMDFIHAPAGPWPGAAHASALLSRFAIRSTTNHALLEPGLSRSFLAAEIMLLGGEALRVGVLHLPARGSDADEDARLAELEIILRMFEADREARRPHLLCGDFNSNAPYQNIDVARCKTRTQREWSTNGNRLPRRAVQRLLDAGYVDTHRLFHNETGPMWDGTFTTECPGQRVDYIFAHGVEAGRIRDAWIVRDEAAAAASDHFPIAVEID